MRRNTVIQPCSGVIMPLSKRQVFRLLAGAALVAVAWTAGAQGAPTPSNAANELAYRGDAAVHIYRTYADRVYKGKLPPLVHAVVIVETEVDAFGAVRAIEVIRSPSHAPEVTVQVQELIRRASPFPATSRLHGAKFTETWLVDHSGRFQLHSLSEGQTFLAPVASIAE
jgi:hypothetical protein